jgi:hypothetical protein
MLVVDIGPLFPQPVFKITKLPRRLPTLHLVPEQAFRDGVSENLNSFMDVSRGLA